MPTPFSEFCFQRSVTRFEFQTSPHLIGQLFPWQPDCAAGASFVGTRAVCGENVLNGAECVVLSITLARTYYG